MHGAGPDKLAKRRLRRWRRKLRRGKLVPAKAQAVSARTRLGWWPVTKAITRRHRMARARWGEKG